MLVTISFCDVTSSFEDALDGGVARRGGLQRRNEVSTVEVRSDRTPQPAREQGLFQSLVKAERSQLMALTSSEPRSAGTNPAM